MVEIRHPEFLSELENTKYPFSPKSSLTNGDVSLLEGTFLDAHVYPVVGGDRYYLSRVEVSNQSITLSIGNLTTRVVASGSIDLPITDNNVALYDEHGRPAGIIVSEPLRLSTLIAWGTGSHVFEPRHTEFAITCQMPVPNPGVTGFRLPDGSVLSGKVWFVGESGVVLQAVDILNQQGNTERVIQISVVGDPLFLQKLCDPESLFVPANPVRVLRIVNNDYTFDSVPDDHGNFSISVNDSMAIDTALRVRTSTDGIVFEVEGSTPNK